MIMLSAAVIRKELIIVTLLLSSRECACGSPEAVVLTLSFDRRWTNHEARLLLFFFLLSPSLLKSEL